MAEDVRYRSREDRDDLYWTMSDPKNWRQIIPVLVKAGNPVDKKATIWKLGFNTRKGNYKTSERKWCTIPIEREVLHVHKKAYLLVSVACVVPFGTSAFIVSRLSG